MTPRPVAQRSRKRFLLRDHAPLQLQLYSAAAAKMRGADGARVGPRRAGLWRHRPDAVWPAAGPPASAGPGAGIRDPGSNAGSNAAACTCAHSLCAGRSAPVVVADRYGNGSGAYHDGSPRECDLPRDSPGRMRYRSPRALMQTATRTLLRQSMRPSLNQTGEGNGLTRARPSRRP